MLIALDVMDQGIAPTSWQRAQYPQAFRPRIAVVHDGVERHSHGFPCLAVR